MLIPASRRFVTSTVLRVVSLPPLPLEEKVKLTDKDYLWSVTDLEGETLEIASLKNEILIVNFWATWCSPCLAEMPSLQKLYDQYGQDVKLLLISKEDPSLLRDFMDNKGYTMPVYTLSGSIPALFQAESIPCTYIISKEGELLLKKEGAADWDGYSVHHLLDGLLTQ